MTKYLKLLVSSYLITVLPFITTMYSLELITKLGIMSDEGRYSFELIFLVFLLIFLVETFAAITIVNRTLLKKGL